MKTNIIIDSTMTSAQALKQNPENNCPQEIMDELAVLNVEYISFDDQFHRGQIVVHRKLKSDITGAFRLLREERFPLQTVIPISDDRYLWDDTPSTQKNNTSAFNYRFERNTNIVSNHAYGRAIDINPKLNPYFHKNAVFPEGSSYNPNIPGTIREDSILVKYFKDLGWDWGGDWDGNKDYQHFEKLI